MAEPPPPPPPPPPHQPDMAAISVAARLPDFWKDQPRLWFIQVEAVLQPQHISDEVKYNLIVAKLNKEIIQQVTDILVSPPATNKYAALKTRLLSVYEETENRKIQKLISEMDLGDQSPSQLLRKMRDLAGDKIKDETLIVLWQNHLPTAVRAVLAVADKSNLDILASIADTIIESTRNNSGLAEIHQAPSTSSDAAWIAEIGKLTNRLSNLERSRNVNRFNRGNRRQRSRSNSRHRRRTPARTPESPDWLCFYHFKYQDKAAKCIAPCNWKKENNQGN